MSDLSFYRTNHNALDKIFLYKRINSNYWRCGNYIQCEELNVNDWFLLLANKNSLSSIQYYTSMNYGSYEGITYSVQWNTNIRENYPGYNIVYAVFSVKNLLPLFADDDILTQSFISISDKNSDIVFSHSGIKWNPQIKYHTLTDKSEVTSAFFEIKIPESVIFGKMKPVRHLMTGFAIFIVFITISLSLYFAYKWSQPMQNFLLSIDSSSIFKSEYEQNLSRQNFGLWNYFRRLYSGLSKSINVMDTKLDDSLRTINGQASLLKEQIFYKALYIGIYNVQDEQLFTSMFSDFPANYQLALVYNEIFYNNDQLDISFVQKNTAVQLQLINTVKSNIGNIYIHSVGENNIILLLPLNEQNESWYERLQSLRKNLNQQTDLALQFSLSSVYDKPQDLSRAWQELQTIVTAFGIQNSDNVKQIQDVKNLPDAPLDINKLNMIYNALNNGNDDTACNILSGCYVDLNNEKDIFTINSIFILLREMLVLLKRKNPTALIGIKIPQYIHGMENEFLGKQIPECFHCIGKLIRHKNEENLSQFGNKILEYINQNLYNPGLYSTMVQDHFNISQPTLQKLTKQVTGQTFLVYVETCRLTKARELLSKGKITIREISEECGFSNTNSFYKAFKKFYGFPPSDIKNYS